MVGRTGNKSQQQQLQLPAGTSVTAVVTDVNSSRNSQHTVNPLDASETVAAATSSSMSGMCKRHLP